MRWLSRLRSGQPLWRKPGPKKVRPADWATLLQDLRALCPGRCRTRGTGSLYRRYARWLSRRELAQLARVLRQNQLDSMKHILWLKTGLAWSIDATEYGPDGTLIVPVQDLASRYRLPAFAAPRLQGPAVANHLHRLFQQFGPPLFLKRDNGSPFNHHLVDALLARYCVLPLNNPPHFPRYNGAMERGISELKRCLNQLYATQTDSSQSPNGLSAGSKNGSPHHSHKKQMRPASNTEADFSQALPFSEFLLSGACNFSLTLENTLHHLNHKNRRSLQGRTACACFHDPQQRLRLTKRQRQLIFRLLCQRFWQRVKTMTPRNHQQFAALWRQTVESWLRCQGLISVRLNKKVSTILPNFLSHN
jgi:transposase InsO family protein